MTSVNKFIFYSISGFISILITYVLLVDQLVFLKREIPYVYRQFLLESSRSIKGKVIIESGSNSIHGIDPILLSRYFKTPAITIADNGDYPLRLKIFNLEKFAQPGDIIILPLEWNQYYYEKNLPENFVTALADEELKLAYYYNNLPLQEKLRFTLTQFPVYEVIKSFKHKRDREQMLQADLNRLNKFTKKLQLNSIESFGNSSRNGPEQRIIPPIHKTCQKYLFHQEMIISDVFKRNLQLLTKLRNKGIDIYFTWPTVVDHEKDRCFADSSFLEKVQKYAYDIKTMVNKEGFQFIGDFQQNLFPSSCFLNTHYHLKQKCAIIRTKQLLKDINLLNIERLNQYVTSDTIAQRLKLGIDKQRQKIAAKIIAHYPASREGTRQKQQLSTDILFNYGWSIQESWGIWSADKESELIFRVVPQLLEKDYLKLSIQGKYFNGSEKTQIIINGKDFGQQLLNNKTFYIPADLVRERDNQVSMILQHTSAVSPAELGISKDKRKIKFGLQSLKLASTNLTQ
jgi:hypothetical protein